MTWLEAVSGGSCADRAGRGGSTWPTRQHRQPAPTARSVTRLSSTTIQRLTALVDKELAAGSFGQLRPEEGAGGVRSGRPSPLSSRCATSAATAAVKVMPSPARSHPSRTVPDDHSARARAQELGSRSVSCAQGNPRHPADSEAADAGDAEDRGHGRQHESRNGACRRLTRRRDDVVGVARAPGRRQFAAGAARRGENLTVGSGQLGGVRGESGSHQASLPDLPSAEGQNPHDGCGKGGADDAGFGGDGRQCVDAHPCRRWPTFAQAQHHALGSRGRRSPRR